MAARKGRRARRVPVVSGNCHRAVRSRRSRCAAAGGSGVALILLLSALPRRPPPSALVGELTSRQRTELRVVDVVHERVCVAMYQLPPRISITAEDPGHT